MKEVIQGFDLINVKVLQNASGKCFKAITQIFNASIRTNHFPPQTNGKSYRL